MELGHHHLDLHAQVLRNSDGAAVFLRPQAWSVLCELAANAGRLVTKEQMLDKVWPGRVVTDGSLAQAIRDVRAALGPTDRELVKTVARRGYMITLPTTGDLPVARPAAFLSSADALIGREEALDAVSNLLGRHRLVTLLGPGGVGKTRLAKAVALAHIESLGTCVGWIDLSRISDPLLIPAAIAHALDLPISQSGAPLPGLLVALRPLSVLVVFDNAEHVVDAVAEMVGSIVAAAPLVHVLTTSQAPLRIEGERVYRVATLDVPGEDTPFEDACRAGAVQLFSDRARAVVQDFELTCDNVAGVVRLCRRLDGLPLAIRLAAARLPLFGIEGVEEHLNERLDL